MTNLYGRSHDMSSESEEDRNPWGYRAHEEEPHY